MVRVVSTRNIEDETTRIGSGSDGADIFSTRRPGSPARRLPRRVEQQLAARPAADEVLLGAARLRQAVGPADDRAQLAARRQVEQLGQRLLEVLAALQVVKEPEADHRLRPLQQPAGADLVLVARGD